MTCKFNQLIIGGNLTRDPETRHTDSGVAVSKFTLAVDHGWGEKKSTAFIDCVLFGKRAESFDKHHSKGSGAFIRGSIKQENWESKKTGEKRSKLVMVGDDWSFNERSDKKAEGQGEFVAAPVDPLDGEAPF